MIQDVREHAGGELRADVCVVGAGPAGITLARELAARSKQVVLAEGGGMAYEGESQELYAGDSSGERYPIQTTRQRYFGGTSNHWEGYCTPLGGLDFQARSWVPRSGWPIRPGVITMDIGPVIEPEGLKPGQINERVSEWIEARMAEIE